MQYEYDANNISMPRLSNIEEQLKTAYHLMP